MERDRFARTLGGEAKAIPRFRLDLRGVIEETGLVATRTGGMGNARIAIDSGVDETR